MEEIPFIEIINLKIKMEKVIKQCVGIDCGKDELVVSFGVMNQVYDIQILSNTKFKNVESGFKKLLQWSEKLKSDSSETIYLMEATGVYYEKAALHLHEHGCKVVVILPNKAKAFSKTLSVKTVNDKVSGQMLAQLGLEKKLDLWQPAPAIYNQLRQLSRERDQLINEQTQIKNQLHAEESGAWPNQQSIKRMKARLKLIAKQVDEAEKEITQHVIEQPWLEEKIKKVCTIKGVGLLTAVTVIAETNGFSLVRNKKQLVSYAGLDVITKDSGTSVRSKPRISRHGNKYLRKCLYLPALSAIRSADPMKALFVRLVSKHGIKMKAAVAVQRKLLVLIYTLWKKDQIFDESYYLKREEPAVADPCELA
jgi:transposase